MSGNITVNVELGERSYPIHIGEKLLSRSELIKPYIKGKQVCIVSNDVVAPLYLEQFKAGLGSYELSEFIFPDGEAEKTLDNVAQLYDALLAKRFERNGTLIALGGGVIGDMTGFAAATYQRGVNFIQVPTTLLAQVDSSVGGKTGVNRPLGKNMVGAFYQPRCVIADTDTLSTLPDRELSAGLAEVIKYGLINNLEFYRWLESKMASLLGRDAQSLSRAIQISCEEKAAIVAADERESGIRAILNLGHTFGHAIEAAMGYGSWLHGEAVGVGMLMAADLSWRLGMIEKQELARIRALIEAAGLPLVPPDSISVEQYLSLMSHDKKAEQGKMRFVLLQGLGKALVQSDIEPNLLKQTLQAGAKLGLSPSNPA